METLVFLLGILGAAMVVFTYWALEQGRIGTNDMRYYAVNGAGAFLVFISILYSYDSGDVGGLLVEGLWVVISLMGMTKILRKKKHA